MIFSKMLRSINYLLDLSLLDIGFLRYEPSTIAAAAACFTNIQSGLEAWPQKIQDDTGITKEDFSKCLKDLHRYKQLHEIHFPFHFSDSTSALHQTKTSRSSASTPMLTRKKSLSCQLPPTNCVNCSPKSSEDLLASPSNPSPCTPPFS